MKRALVTGSDGLIGRHMCTRLFNDGWTITPIDIESTNPNSRFDVRDFFRTDTTCYDLVAHCAAYVGGRQDIETRRTYIAAMNYQLDGALFEWALRTWPAHVIYWSSSAAYPTLLQTGLTSDGSDRRLHELDIDLDRPRLADESYGAVKLAGEQMAAWAAEDGLKVHVFRPFSGWAADQSTDYPMGAFLARARHRLDPFDIWGDGTQVRDWIHVDDMISAALAAIEQDYPGPLNLCSGLGTSFTDLAQMVCDIIGYSPQFAYLRHRPSGVRYRVGDPTEMHTVWPQEIDLERYLRKALL